MCGIAGIFDFNQVGSPAERLDVTRSMGRALIHRGPDSDGDWSDPEAGIAFAHRRLSIIDLSSSGNQPMFSSNGRWVLVFNGEIYNFEILRSELIELGITFIGRSDTEVVVEAIAMWGVEASVSRFNGMFAFAVWDRENHALALARDPSGVKPLYWGFIGQKFVFASELKALRAIPNWHPEINRSAAGLYARFGYIPSPHTIYQGIRKLSLGSSLEVTAEGKTREWEYAKPSFYEDFVIPSDEGVVIDQLDQLIRQAVKRRSVADVPVGAFLSGGVDSAMVVSAFQTNSNSQVNTFTVGFDDEKFDESAASSEVAKRLGTNHQQLSLSDADAAMMAHSLPIWYDEPFADSSQIPMAAISKFARGTVKVALSGDGGDELFAGYARHIWADKVWRRLSMFPKFTHEAIGSIPKYLSGKGFDAINDFLPRGLRFSSGSQGLSWYGELFRAKTDYARYVQIVSLGGESLMLADAPVPNSDRAAQFNCETDPLKNMLEMDRIVYLPDDILVKLDRATMAFGLEGREPFLDEELIQYAKRIPGELKIQDGRGKHILRAVLSRYLPQDYIERPKQGFSIPLGKWLREGLSEWAEDRLLSKDFLDNGLYDPIRVGNAWRRFVGGDDTHSAALWSVLMYEDWRQHWMCGSIPQDSSA